MLSNNALLQTIKIIGTRQDIVHLLEISRQRLNGWLNGEVLMGYEYALILQFLTSSQIKAEELAPQKAEILKKFGININFNYQISNSPLQSNLKNNDKNIIKIHSPIVLKKR